MGHEAENEGGGAVYLQPTIPKSDRLLARCGANASASAEPPTAIDQCQRRQQGIDRNMRPPAAKPKRSVFGIHVRAPFPPFESDPVMYKFVSGILASLLLSIGAAHAAPSDDACAALMEARGHLVAMIGSTDKAAHTDLMTKIHVASAKVDSVIGGMGKSYNAGNEAQANAFKPVWDAFKTTRENEIIPAVLAGKNAEAKALATGIQSERMKQMRSAMNCK
jgi:hypothetical protein